jgi:hypothetical protein
VSTEPDRRGFAPHSEYARRLNRWRRAAVSSDRIDRRISLGRLLTVGFGAVLGWWIWRSPALGAVWILVPVVLFILLAVAHERVIRGRRRAQRAVSHYRAGLARLEDRWSGAGEPGTRYRRVDHPYAEDLDLFGDGSLFQRICSARTRAGEGRLAAWLQEPAPVEEVGSRQEAVQELRDRLDLREDLALLGEEFRSGGHPKELAAWATAPPILSGRSIPMALIGLVLLTIGSLTGWVTGMWGPLPVLGFLLLEGIAAMIYRGRVRKVVAAVERPGQDLGLLSQVLGRIERETFRSDRLAGLRRALDTAGLRPSRRIRHLDRWIELLDSRRNQLFAPFAAVLMWTTLLAFAIEAWRRVAGPAVPRWLEAVAEFEAIESLAAYSYENPDDPFPEIVFEGPVFEGEALGHPLIPVQRCVRNDLRLGDGHRLFIVSGSNMSGKSTLLRAVGANTVLALAGAPVRARRLRLSPLAVGASIRIVDSLQEGSSRFYSEITRLHQLQVMAAGSNPVLFLLDEILHGTNSHDRRIGAEAVVREFLERGGVGLITTHDLALTAIADGLGERAVNIHFEDQFVDGRMAFDYRIRPGVVRKSNALQLMRSVGLEV